jgi:hypothetical protein
MDNVISADESDMLEIQMKTMNRARELTELFSISKMGVIHHAIQGLRTKYSCEFDASKLFKQLDQMAPAKAHWTFTPAVMILISLAVFLTGTLIWKKCLRNSEPLAPISSVPLMPMPIITQRPINKATNLNASIPIFISIS